MTTNSLNNETKADFTVKGASGSARKVRVENDNNTASSIACSEAYVGGTSAGDAFVRHVVGSSHSYALGVDNSDSDKWKLTYSADATATPSSANVIMNADTSGRWRRPMTPLFEAYLGTDNTGVSVETIIFDQEVFDQGSNYNHTSGVFTCPVAGTYLFETSVLHTNVAASNENGALYIYDGTWYQYVFYYDPDLIRSGGAEVGIHGCLVFYAAASDTFEVIVRNDSGETTTVESDYSRFSGYLLG